MSKGANEQTPLRPQIMESGSSLAAGAKNIGWFASFAFTINNIAGPGMLVSRIAVYAQTSLGPLNVSFLSSLRIFLQLFSLLGMYLALHASCLWLHFRAYVGHYSLIPWRASQTMLTSTLEKSSLIYLDIFLEIVGSF